MALKKYGVLKGTILGHLRDADDDHYQVLVRAADTIYRIAVNVKSAAPNAPSTLLFLAGDKLPDAYLDKLQGLQTGFTKLPSKPGGLAMDYVRTGWFKPDSMKEVPPDEPGVDNDLKDKLEEAVVKSMDQPGSIVYAFGERWGPERKRRDQYFKFVPGNGIHDIHMNQGSTGKYKKYNGVYQDGGLVFERPGSRWLAFFFAFQSQTFETDESGNPSEAERAVRRKRAAGTKSRKRSGSKRTVKRK